MVPTDVRSSLSAVLLVALVATSGCLGAVTADDAGNETAEPTPEPTTTDVSNESDDRPGDGELTDRVRQRAANVDTLVVTRNATYTVDGDETTTTSRIWTRLDTGEYRQETIAADGTTGSVFLANESVVLNYNTSRNVVRVLDDSGTSGGYGSGTIVSALRNVSEVRYQDTVTIDGEETYRVRIVPQSGLDEDTTVTAWIDPDTDFPERIRVEDRSSRTNYSYVVDYENVSINADIPDERFVLDAPEDAEWREPTTTSTESYDSREALVEAVNASVPDPDVPGAYEFEEGLVIDRGSDTSVMLEYSNGSSSLNVQKLQYTYSNDGGENAENVSVNGHGGQYREVSGQAYVVWQCGGRTYTVSGRLSKADLLAIAESIECE